MYAAFAGQFRAPVVTWALPSTLRFEARAWARRAARHSAVIGDGAAILAGAGLASLLYPCCSLPEIGWPAIVQMAVSASIIGIGGLRHCGLYPDGLEAPPVDPVRMTGALLVACLAALGLAFPDASRHVHLWVWAGFWMASSLAGLIVVRLLARELLAALAAYGEGSAAYSWSVSRTDAPVGTPAPGGLEKPKFISVYDSVGEAGFALDWWPGFDQALREFAGAPDSGQPQQVG